MTRVFIAYSHDSDAHKQKVLALAAKLRADGIDARLDQYVNGGPTEGWPRWCSRQIKEAGYVLVVCSRKEEEWGAGLTWELNQVLHDIYRSKGNNARYIPVLLDLADKKFIPDYLSGQSHYVVTNKEGYEKLYRHLSGQPEVRLPPLGNPLNLPAGDVPQLFEELPALKTYTARMPSTPGKLFGRADDLAVLDAAWSDDTARVRCLVAWGGVGKTSLVNNWLNLMADENWCGAERVYAWSFYSQGAGEDRQVSSDPFIDHALSWFGDPDPTVGDAWARAERLAGLIRRKKTLLVLDGLEPLQYPPGVEATEGRVRDAAMKTLLRGLQHGMDGLCLVTTRLPVEDLDDPETQYDLALLKPAAGKQLLTHLGVKGTSKELTEVVEAHGGHALALSLLGRYLAGAHGGDIRRKDRIKALEKAPKQGAHAFRVLAEYETWFAGKAEEQLLLLTGLFDRPAERAALQQLRNPPIPGLTDRLPPDDEEIWNLPVNHLADLGLMTHGNWEDADLDAHPLVREHFGARLEEKHPETFQTAHERLYHYYRQLPKKDQPDTLVEMEPLFRAVTHGCRAGKHQEALEEVFWPRIRHGEQFYTWHQLGAYGADLAAVANFFQTPWATPAPGLEPMWQAVVLNWAGFALRALGRLREATQPLAAGMERWIKDENWLESGKQAGILSELWLTLGDVPQAVEAATRAVAFADKSGDSHQKMNQRAKQAGARHQAGETERAASLFAEAEALEQEGGQPFLYSLLGFLYNDFLVGQEDFGEAGKRVHHSFKISKSQGWLLDQGLDQIILGRLAHAAWRAGEGTMEEAVALLDDAVTALRKANSMHHVPRGHLARAAFNIDWGNLQAAEADLNEARHIAERGEMKLHLTDIALAEARLAEVRNQPDRAAERYAEARRLIEETGYKRRLPELPNVT